MKQVDISTFDLEVGSGLSVVQFGSNYCNPCKMLKPIVTELSEEITEVNFLYVDVENSPELASRYGILSIPVLMVFEDGNVVDQSVGFQPKGKVVEMIEKYL